MAKYGKALAHVSVEINGQKQAEQVLKAMTSAAAEMRKNIKLAKIELEQLALSGGGPAYDAKKKEILGMEKELKQIERSIRETKKFSEDIGSILDNMSKNNATVLNRTKRALESLLSSITPNTKKAQAQILLLQKAIKQISDEIDRRKGKIVEFEDIMNDLGKATPKQLDAVEKRLISLLDSVTKNSNAWRKYNKQLQEVQGEKGARKKSEMESQMENIAKLSVNARNELKKYWQGVNDGSLQGSKAFKESLKYLQDIEATEKRIASDKAKKVLEKPKNYSVGEINEAIKVAEQMQADTKDKKEWADLAAQISKAKEVRDSFADSAKLKVMSEQFKHVKDLSANALAEQKKYWTEVKNNLTESDPLYKKAVANLERMDKIESDRVLKQSKDTLTTKLNTAGTADIKQSVEWLTKYQSTLEPLGPKWQKINELIQKGNDRLKEVTDKSKYEVMATQFGNLSNLSVNALSEQKKYWTEVKNSFAEGSGKYTEAIEKLKEIDELETNRMKDQASKTLSTNLLTSGTADIKQSIDWLTKYQGSLEPLGPEWEKINALIEAGNIRLKDLSDVSKYKAMTAQFSRLIQLSDAALTSQKKYWEDVFRNAEKGTAEYIDAESKLKQIKNLEQSRIRTEATATISQAITGNFDKTNEETREAIKLIEEYKKQLATGNVDAIKEADKAISELNRKLDQARLSSARGVLGDMDSHSTEQIKQAVDWLTKYRSTLATSTQEWKDLGIEIEKANEYMRNAEGADKMAVMEQKLNHIGTVSTSALVELKKYWQEVVDGTDKGNANLAQYEDNLRRVIEEEKTRKAVSAEAIMTNLDGSSVAQIREAVKATEELRESVQRSDPQWEQYNAQIENAKNYLEKFEIEAKKAAALDVAANLDIASTGEMKQTIDFLSKYRDTLSSIDPEYDSITKAIEDTTEALKNFNDSAKMDVMNRQMQNLNNLSKAALSEQKKYWQGVYDSAEKTSQAYKDAESNLMKIDLLERSRISSDASKSITEALSGSWDKTIKDTEEAIKLIQEYKNQLRIQSDTVLIDQANEAIEALNRNLGKAKESLMNISEAKRIAAEVDSGLFDGTSKDIEDAKKALEEFRKTLNLDSNKDDIDDIDKSLASLAASAELGSKNLKSLDEVLGNLKSASMDDLQSAAKRLQAEIKKAERGTEEYAKTSLKLQRVNKEIEKAKKEWEGQESLFIRMTKRLSVYMAAYGSLSAITSYVKDLGKANLQLSDSIADVAKTTGLGAKELAKLGEDIRAIDTRTAQEQLYELAAAAGQLGIKSEAEVAGFVRAANMITVSLNELGTEATTQLMKIATLTGESQEGTEKALLSIGSAINELTASSAAAAGPIVDLMNRMGGIAAQSKITSAQMAAIGATADALGQSVEITGTSMNKFLATLMSNTDQIAYALNMDARALRSFINEGRTMDAVVAIFERMNDMGGLSKLAPIMGDLGSEGARMTQVLAAMAEKVDFLKSQLEISTEAYDSATSIQNEYNVKNENAIAILQRMGNAIKEAFVNNVFVDALTATLRTVYSFFKTLGEGSAKAYVLTSAIAGLTAALLANRLAWVQNLHAVTKLYPHLVRLAIWQSLTAAVKSFTLALLATPKAIMNFGRAILQANTWSMLWTNTLKGLSTALKGLRTFLAGNWISVFTFAIAGAVTWMIKAATYVSEAAKATAKYNRELQEETDKVDTLFNSLKRLVSKEEDRAKTINAINQQYSQYLGFMLDEKDSAEKLAAAHQLINAELRKRMALNLRTTLEGTASTDYAEQLEKSSAGIGKAVENLKVNVTGKDQKERSVTTSEVIRFVTKMINKRVAEDTAVSKEQLLDEIKTAMSDEYRRTAVSNTGVQYTVEVGAGLFEDIEGHVEDLIDSRVKFQKAVALAEDQANVEMEQLTEDAIESRKKFLKQTESEINEAKKLTSKLEKELSDAKDKADDYDKKDESKEAVTARQNYEAKEKELREHYEKMVDNANDYVGATQKLMEDYNDSLTENDKKRMNDEIKMYQDFAKETAKLAPGMDPWDKGRDVKDWREFSEIVTNLDTSSAQALAAAFKKIKEESARFPDDVEKVYELFRRQGVDEISLKKLGLKDATSVADMVWKWEKQIKDKLESKFHRNTELGFIFKDDSGRTKKTANEMYKEWLAELEAYYNERETLIRQKGLEQNKLETEINRELEALNAEKLSDQRELEEGLLSDLYKGSTFDPKKFKGVITGTNYFANLTLEHMRSIVSAGGPKLDAEVRKNLTERMVKIEEQAYKIKQRINKILLEDDFTGKIAKQYTDSLDELGLLFNVSTEAMADHSEEEGERRMAYMRQWAKESYQLNADQLKDKMMQNEMFSKWVIDREHEDYEALLLQLRKFHDDELEAEKRFAERRKRLFDKSDKGLKLQKEGQTSEEKAGEKVKAEEEEAKMWDRFKGMDLVSDDRLDEQQIEVGNAQIALYQAKIDASNEYIKQIQLEMAVEKEKVQNTIDNIQRELSNANLSQERRIQLNADLLAAEQQKNSLIRQEEIITNGVKADISENEAKQVEISQEIADRLIAIEQNKISRIKQYTDAIVDFSGQMGEAAFGEVEDRKEAGRQLIKTLLTTLKEHMQIKLTELVMEKMFAEQSVATTAGQVSTELSLTGAKTSADIAAGTASATAKEAGSKGWVGLLVGAAIGAALSALLGLAMGAINKSKSVADSISGTRKHSTGMLTYAKGNYPVLGDDGKVYDAKYEGAGMKTGVYGGGAHFGIFSEKQPEMIVDGKTTQKLILNYPYIYDAITTIAKNGRLKNAMPTFASGDYPAGMKQLAPVAALDNTSENSEQMDRMTSALEQSQAVNRQLLKLLQGGITAHLDGLETHRQQKKNERFLKRRGID